MCHTKIGRFFVGRQNRPIKSCDKIVRLTSALQSFILMLCFDRSHFLWGSYCTILEIRVEWVPFEESLHWPAQWLAAIYCSWFHWAVKYTFSVIIIVLIKYVLMLFKDAAERFTESEWWMHWKHTEQCFVIDVELEFVAWIQWVRSSSAKSKG